MNSILFNEGHKTHQTNEKKPEASKFNLLSNNRFALMALINLSVQPASQGRDSAHASTASTVRNTRREAVHDGGVVNLHT